MKTMDFILAVLGVFLLVFVVVMILLFIAYQSVPDTLIMSVFAACGLEGGVMGWIKTTKDKIREKWEEQENTQAQAGIDDENNE